MMGMRIICLDPDLADAYPDQKKSLYPDPLKKAGFRIPIIPIIPTDPASLSIKIFSNFDCIKFHKGKEKSHFAEYLNEICHN